MGLFSKLFGIDRRMEELVADSLLGVQKGLNLYLTSELAKEYDFKYAVALAAAVEVTVFSEEPWNRAGRDFLASETNRDRARSAIEKLVQPHETLRRLITDAVRIKCIHEYRGSERRSESELRRILREPFETLRQHSILVPGGEPPRLNTFRENVRSFLDAGGPDFPYRET